MAKKKKTKAVAKGKTVAKKKKTPKKKTSVKKKTVKTVKKPLKVKTEKKTQKKKQTQKKTAKETVRKKVKGKGTKGTAKRVVQKSKKPAARVKVRTVSRKTPLKATRTATPLLTPRKELLRKYLISKREEILQEVKSEISKYIKGETNQLVETALDDGDWSVIDVSADINLRRLETHRERLLGIDEALMKLKEGTYGVCEECGGEITSERLKVMPFAVYCRDCQEKKEQIEKIAREEIIT